MKWLLIVLLVCCVLVSGCGPTAEEEAFQRSIDETNQLTEDYLNQ